MAGMIITALPVSQWLLILAASSLIINAKRLLASVEAFCCANLAPAGFLYEGCPQCMDNLLAGRLPPARRNHLAGAVAAAPAVFHPSPRWERPGLTSGTWPIFYPFAVACLANRQEKRPLAWPEDSEKKPQDRMNRPPCGQGLLFRGQSVQRCPLRGKPRSVDQSPSAASSSACCSVISASVSSTRSPSIT